MAIKKEIDIVVNTDDAEKDVKKLDDSIQDVDDSTKKASKGVGGMSKAFKGLGTAFKALGIGLIIALVAKLTEAFSKNQKIADAISTVFETISLVFNQVFEALTNVYESVTESSERFDALKAVVTGLLTIAITPLKLAFFAIKLTIQEAQLAWEKSFFGDKDPTTIKELNEAIQQTQDDIKQTALDAVESGKAIVSNFGEAITEIGEISSQVINEISEISIKNTADQAKQLVELRNAARLAIAENELILKTKQKEAELQRQIRDNVELDLETRKAANDELGRILTESNDLQIANAQKALDLAQLELAANKGSIEAQEALITAQKDYQDVLETTSGFESEQKTNAAALNQEAIDLENSRIQAINDRALAQKDFNAEQQKTELEKLAKQKENLKLEEDLIKEDLARKLVQFKEGTQARQDAEQEALDKQQDISNRRVDIEKAEAKENIRIEQEVANAKAAIRDANLNNAVSAVRLIASLDEDNKALQATSLIAEHGVGIAKSIISTNAANAAVTLKYAALPGGVALAAAEKAANNISAGLGIAASGVALGKGLAALGKGGGGGGSAGLGSDGGGGASAPSFNLVQGTGTNQIAETLGQQQQPIEAFVVSGNVTTAQSLDRNIVDNASL